MPRMRHGIGECMQISYLWCILPYSIEALSSQFGFLGHFLGYGSGVACAFNRYAVKLTKIFINKIFF